ncbi:hypothetical protein LJC34_02250 [Oscillospiraceae bacterium OttesenSCG-928-G22]|nr:hypothetical protein [Oscillospiraceae bacterium OttesenSCG-928-G22]
MKIRKQFLGRSIRGIVIYAVIMAALYGVLFFLFSSDGPSDPGPAFVVFLVFGAMFFLPLIIMLIRLLTGGYTRKFDRYTATLGEAEKETFERNCETGYRFNTAILAGDCVVINERGRLLAIPVKSIVWIYKQDVPLNAYSTRQLTIVTDDKKLTMLLTGKKHDSLELDEFIRRITLVKPGIFVGFDQITHTMFRSDFEEMKRLASGGYRS